MMGLTATQARALDLVRDYIASEGVAPSMDELREGLGLASKSGVVRLLDALQERGHIRRLRGRARSIEVIDRPRTREEICGALRGLSSADLRHVIAVAAGLSAHKDGDGGGAHG